MKYIRRSKSQKKKKEFHKIRRKEKKRENEKKRKEHMQFTDEKIDTWDDGWLDNGPKRKTDSEQIAGQEQGQGQGGSDGNANDAVNHALGEDELEQRIVVDQPRPKRIGVVVRDDVLPTESLKEVYATATQAGVPLGCYVSAAQALAFGKRKAAERKAAQADKGTKDEPLSKLAAGIVHSLFIAGDSPILSREDLRCCHGFMLWCLASNTSQQVSYHIDYAEALRHQTGVTVPPLFGAVLHCTSFRQGDAAEGMQGGNFAVNRRGLDHYREWKYKAKGKRAENADFDEVAEAKSEGERDGTWEFVDYKTNRCIFFDGDLPHMATPVAKIPEGISRVILGINVFGHNVGSQASRFPDHSARTNRVIKMLQAFRRLSSRAADEDSKEKLIQSLRSKAKTLAKTQEK